MRTPLLILALTLMSALTSSSLRAGLLEEVYGNLPDGRVAKIWTLTNAAGLEARVSEYGAILVSLKVPDREGKLADITHGYDTLDGWLGNSAYFGATVGRYGNRIARGKFTLDGKEYTLATNNEPGGIPCALHGGKEGFSMKLWQGEGFTDEGGSGVRLSYTSPDGEEGYPGELATVVTYRLTEKNELIWEATATAKAPTVVNLVHHSYWNLSGDPGTSINDHELTLYADRFLATDAGLIPTGEKAEVAGTPLDFREATAIGGRLDADFEALKLAGGYDHAFILNGTPDGDWVRAARLRDPKSGRVMTLSTNQPAVQFYGGNFLDGKTAGKGGEKYGHRSALCLETENWPDAPNQKNAPSAVLRPGETYRHIMVHTFSAE